MNRVFRRTSPDSAEPQNHRTRHLNPFRHARWPHSDTTLRDVVASIASWTEKGFAAPFWLRAVVATFLEIWEQNGNKNLLYGDLEAGFPRSRNVRLWTRSGFGVRSAPRMLALDVGRI